MTEKKSEGKLQAACSQHKNNTNLLNLYQFPLYEKLFDSKLELVGLICGLGWLTANTCVLRRSSHASNATLTLRKTKQTKKKDAVILSGVMLEQEK